MGTGGRKGERVFDLAGGAPSFVTSSGGPFTPNMMGTPPTHFPICKWGGASDRHPAHLLWGSGEKGRGGVAVHAVSASCVRLCQAHMYSTSEPRPKFLQMTECRTNWV